MPRVPLEDTFSCPLLALCRAAIPLQYMPSFQARKHPRKLPWKQLTGFQQWKQGETLGNLQPAVETLGAGKQAGNRGKLISVRGNRFMGIRRLQAVIQAGPYTMGMHGMGHEGSVARGPPNAMGGGGGGVTRGKGA